MRTHIHSISTYTCGARRREVCFPEVRELHGLVRIWKCSSSNVGTVSVVVVNQVAAVLGGGRHVFQKCESFVDLSEYVVN